VARKRKLEAAAERGAVDGRDEGLAAGLDAPIEQRQLAAFLEQVHRRLLLTLLLDVFRKRTPERLQECRVAPGAERLLGRGDDAAFHGGVGRQPLDDRRQLLDALERDD